jgi:sulfate transport system ATP-binding protein
VVIMNNARIEQVGAPQEVYDQPASPFVYQFLGNVNVLRAQALAEAGVHQPRVATVEADGHVYVRPHDIAVLPHSPDAPGIAAILRYVHAAGSLARLTLEQVKSREQVEVEISRAELEHLNLKLGDIVSLRLRQAHSFSEDYAI